MSVTKPTIGQSAWGGTLNTALDTLDTRITALETQRIVAKPATASSSGTAGQLAYDATHLYVCVATNTWVRASLATW